MRHSGWRIFTPVMFLSFSGAARALSVLLFVPLAGCSGAPSINVFGAFFPGWLFCMAGGFAATLLVRFGLVKSGLVSRLGLAGLLYTSLFVLFSLLAWLLFFK